MRQRILVVDDDPSLAEMLTIVLRGEGFDTAVIGDGTQALTAVRELRPDLVLLDLMLPGMNGIEVTRRILAQQPSCRIIVLTSFADDQNVLAAMQAAARQGDDPFMAYDSHWSASGHSIVAAAVAQALQSRDCP